MKRAAAIFLSLTVIWLQVMASAQTLPTTTAAPQCGCCAGKKACCCVEDSAPAPAPIPIAPTPVTSSIDFTATLAKVLVWMLPSAEATVPVSSKDSSFALPAIPLFQRNCALLI